jgi:hypothetical protein
MFLNVSFNFATAISKYDTFSSYRIVRTRIAKVTNFFPFCTIGISMYQKRILPYYFIIPSTFSPQASSPLSHHRQTEGQTNFKGCYLPKFFFFSTERAGPYVPAGATLLGWPNYGVDGRLNYRMPGHKKHIKVRKRRANNIVSTIKYHHCRCRFSFE